jgi:hypothetical protein
MEASTCYQALPGNTGPEALPPIFPSPREAEPLDIGYQAEPGNQLPITHHPLPITYSPI